MQLQIKRLTDTAKIPTRAHQTDAGLDIFADEDIIIANGETVTVCTGLSMAIQEGFYGRLVCRSGISFKTPLRVIEGTIDADYRGEVKVICELRGFTYFPKEKAMYRLEPTQVHEIKKGDKIAQLIIQALPPVDLVEMKELGTSARGENGFGSTGTK